MTIKKNGGMWFWTIGRIGGTFYVKRKTRHPFYEAPKGAWVPPAMRDIAAMFLISLGISGGLILLVAGLVEASNI